MIILREGDALEEMRALESESVDSVVTDPPYGLSFMGKRWDYDVPSVDIWAECLRVLKPGGHLLAFAGTRTQHRMAVRIEDAGFEIRDMIAWLYGSGFPKSLDVSKAIDKAAGAVREVVGCAVYGDGHVQRSAESIGYGGSDPAVDARLLTAPATDAAAQWQGLGTALKPALEPITVARKPMAGTVAENVLQFGTGALNIDGCRVPTNGEIVLIHNAPAGTFAGGEAGRGSDTSEYRESPGRWPANVIHDGSDEVVGLFPQSKDGVAVRHRSGGKNCHSAAPKPPLPDLGYGGGGSAARFFKQIEVTDAEWLENLSPALIADSTLSMSKLADAIAQSDAAISALPEGRQLNVLKAPSTSVTPSESKLIATSVITAIQSIASASLLAQQPERLSLSHSHVSVVARQTPTGIMMITASLSSSAGCAESITFSITPKSLAVGEKVCGQSSARFMYCAKASRKDRNEGCEGNGHPTVKPTNLMRYLCRLVTPPGGVVLDPFAGSGSTGKAAVLEGFRFIGIEREAEYVKIAKARISAVAPLFGAPEIGL